MSSPVPEDSTAQSQRNRLTGHLEAALEEADDDNLRFHIRQALQFAAKSAENESES